MNYNESIFRVSIYACLGVVWRSKGTKEPREGGQWAASIKTNMASLCVREPVF